MNVLVDYCIKNRFLNIDAALAIIALIKEKTYYSYLSLPDEIFFIILSSINPTEKHQIDLSNSSNRFKYFKYFYENHLIYL